MDFLELLQTVPIDHLLLGASTLLLISVMASRLSGWTGVPALLLFLGIGMLAGSEGFGGIDFDHPQLVQSIGIIALALILYSGGLDTHWHDIRPVLGKGLALATVGVVLTAAFVAWLTAYLLQISPTEAFLFGAIVSSTDAAAVFAVLRARRLTLRGHLAPLLELESGSNDPMAVFLTLGLIGLLMEPGVTMWDMVPMFVKHMVLGGLLGYGMGMGIAFMIRWLRLEGRGLYAVFSLAAALFTYGLTASIGGNGFLAVYLAGLTVGTSNIRQLEHLRRYHEGEAWLMQILMFLMLGLQAFPSRILSVVSIGLILSFFLIFLARPLAVWLTLRPAGMSWREILFIAWGGLRGAVPIVLATFPVLAGVPQAATIFPLVFFIVLSSVLLQGTTLPLVAKWLGVIAEETERTGESMVVRKAYNRREETERRKAE